MLNILIKNVRPRGRDEACDLATQDARAHQAIDAHGAMAIPSVVALDARTPMEAIVMHADCLNVIRRMPACRNEDCPYAPLDGGATKSTHVTN